MMTDLEPATTSYPAQFESFFRAAIAITTQRKSSDSIKFQDS